MAVAPGPDPVPCPCDACDEFAGSPDTYCVKCIHHGCAGQVCRCPDAERSTKFCDCCHQQAETVPAHPDSEGNRICGDCHPDGVLPDEDEWWDEPEQQADDGDACVCGDEFGYRTTASCRSCGRIPPEHRW